MKTDTMTLRLTRWVFGSLLAVMTATSVPACSPMEEAASFWVHGVIAVTPREQCVASADARIFRPYGTMDIWMTNRYRAAFKVENYLVSTRAKFGVLYGENDNIQIMGAHVSFEYPDGLDQDTIDALSQSRFVPATGVALPEKVGAATAIAIQPDLGNVLAADTKIRGSALDYGGVILNMKVRLEGRLGDGTIVKSNEYEYPLQICYGCLYQIVTADCNDLSDANDMAVPCFIGQDDGVDCRLFTLWGADPSTTGN